ncbi:MAG TPA: TonB-dependent receptor [Kofleriaceae bacterium]|nr:TonB-dependent receptor [Kofleriaceae bacterium]
MTEQPLITRSTRYFVAAAIASLCALCATPALAQEPTAPPPVAGPPPTPPPEAGPPTTIHGSVVAADTGAPQAGATVSVPDTGAVVFTDDRGRYTLSVPAGSHVVRVELQGYAAREQTVSAGASPVALDFRLAEDQLGEVINIVGSRTPRSKLETPVPIDVIPSETISESTQTETNQLLNTIAPSFSASHLAIVDGTDHIDPAELRGLGPEHVLVLINGKRLHQSSLVNIYNGGTVGVDLNAIPTSAIARIEVLRDGAASQYGSDAIAGVINIVLKEDVDTVDLYSMTGITASNDGMQFKIGGNTGMRLGNRGFLNLTAEYFTRGRTNRSNPYSGNDIFPGIDPSAPDAMQQTEAELARRGLTRRSFTMDVGQAGADVGTAFLNSAYKLDDTFELHAQGGLTVRKGYASGFYRFPSQENRVDLQIYPNGFLPEINPMLYAWTATAGVRARRGPWDGDLSVTDGGDRFHFFVDHSLNASLGPASPTHFDAGSLNFHQTSVNLDGVYRIEQQLLKAVSAVGGAEIRHEDSHIIAGQPESYELGPELNSEGNPKSPGSQVFPGFQPSDARDYTRLSEALYAGLEAQPTARTNFDVGGRFEHYSDFGSTVTGKVDGRVAVLRQGDNELAVRGSASTGFRAPGLQQLGYSTIATQLVGSTLTNILVSPNNSPVTKAFGVPDLKEETSVNLSAGATAHLLGNLSLSADYYHVTIKDRIILTGYFSAEFDPMVDNPFGHAVADIIRPFPGTAVAQFFVNAVDTTTNGVDLVLDYTHRLTKGSLKATAAANFTGTHVDEVHVPQSMIDKFASVDPQGDKVKSVFLDRYGRNRLTDLLPREKGTVGLRWDRSGWTAGVRGNFFGPTEFKFTDGDGNILDESFGAKVTFDLDVGYRLGGMWWNVGATNVFNTFPDEVKRPENRNNETFLYTPAGLTAGAPFGTDGAFYFVRAGYRF